MRRTSAANAPPVALISEGLPAFLARPQWSPDGKWILCETEDGLTVVRPDGTGKHTISDPGWLTYAWDTDSRRIYGLRPTDDLHHFMLVSLDMQTGGAGDQPSDGGDSADVAAVSRLQPPDDRRLPDLDCERQVRHLSHRRFSAPADLVGTDLETGSPMSP